MNSYFDYIKDALLKELGENYSKIVLYAEFGESTAATFVRYNKLNESIPRSVNDTSHILEIVASVRKTQIHNGLENIWSGLIYVLENEQVKIQLLYDNDIDRNDMLMIKAQKQIIDEYFPDIPDGSN